MRKKLGYCTAKAGKMEYKIHLYLDENNEFSYQVKSSNLWYAPPHLFKEVFKETVTTLEYVKERPLVEAPLLIPIFDNPTEEGISFIQEAAQTKMQIAMKTLVPLLEKLGLTKKDLPQLPKVFFDKSFKQFKIEGDDNQLVKDLMKETTQEGNVVKYDFKKDDKPKK